MFERLSGDVEALRLAIEAMDAPTVAMVKKLAQYKQLLARAGAELTRFTAYMETELDAAAFESIKLGLQHSKDLIAASGITAQFQGIGPNAMRQALRYLDPDGPLYARLKLLTGATVDKVSQSILEGIGMGRNPQVIARMIQDSFGGGLTDALRQTRTVQMYSYRDSARANYQASDGIVTGWVWYAELDGNQCEACSVEHGSIHDLDETMDSHWNCRCACVPYIEGLSDPITTGEEWFNGLSDLEQAAYLGQSKYDGLKSGAFTFDQMATRNESTVYGQMIGVTPLKDLVKQEP
jgi:hypothetical protein